MGGIIMNKDAWMTLYFIPSPKGLNWDNPTALVRDIVKNRISLDNRFLGHVIIELDYYNEKNEHIHFITGVSSNLLNTPSLILKDKIGFGIIFYSFDGYLENKEKLKHELAQRFQKGNKAINFAKFKINISTAKRAEQYLSEYSKHDISNYFGLVNSPLHGEGAGCATFGASFMDVAGLLEKEHKKHWSNCIKVPDKLIGNPIHENKVSFLGLLFGQHSWATKDEKHHEIFFWDPDLMHRWAEMKLGQYHPDESEYSLEVKKNSTGVVYDMTHKETPTGPIFKRVGKDGQPFSNLPNVKEEQSNKYKYD